MSKIRVAVVGTKEYYDAKKNYCESMGWIPFHVDSRIDYETLRGMKFEGVYIEEGYYVED